jgi:hypothetical protein
MNDAQFHAPAVADIDNLGILVTDLLRLFRAADLVDLSLIDDGSGRRVSRPGLGVGRHRDQDRRRKQNFQCAVFHSVLLNGISILASRLRVVYSNLMQAIARANRVFPGKDCGIIVDYNGMLKSLRETLAKYAVGDEDDDGGEIVAPIEELVAALVEAITAAEEHPGTLDSMQTAFGCYRLRPYRGFAGCSRCGLHV